MLHFKYVMLQSLIKKQREKSFLELDRIYYDSNITAHNSHWEELKRLKLQEFDIRIKIVEAELRQMEQEIASCN